MSDLIERLRSPMSGNSLLCNKAADRIKELEAVIEGDLESFKMAGELYTAKQRIKELEGLYKASCVSEMRKAKTINELEAENGLLRDIIEDSGIDVDELLELREDNDK